MNEEKYWIIKPHTERKLSILKRYFEQWCAIFHSQWKNKKCSSWKIVYYVDCFCGRGKYNKGDKKDVVDGSPLIAIKCAKDLMIKHDDGFKIRCIFIDNNQKYINDLKKFSHSFLKDVDCEFHYQDINEIIEPVMKRVGSSPTLFFIDPFGNSQINISTLTRILNKKGPKDIILNYICGSKRVFAAIDKLEKDGKTGETLINLKKSQAKYFGPELFEEILQSKKLKEDDKQKLKLWTDETFKDCDLNYRIIYPMRNIKKRKNIVYFLLFATRKLVGQKVMKYIFKDEDKIDLNNQLRMFPIEEGKFDI